MVFIQMILLERSLFTFVRFISEKLAKNYELVLVLVTKSRTDFISVN